MLALERGMRLNARAKPYAEFELYLQNKPFMSMEYFPALATENQGGTLFRCKCDGDTWELHYFPTSWLQRESYKVLRNSEAVLHTDVLRIARWVDVTFADGVRWKIRVGVFNIKVRNGSGEIILRSSPRIGFIMGRSGIKVEKTENNNSRLIPLLLVLLHLSTHHKN
jgi:hypothetical protein